MADNSIRKLAGTQYLDYSQVRKDADEVNKIMRSIGEGVNFNLSSGIIAAIQRELASLSSVAGQIQGGQQNTTNAIVNTENVRAASSDVQHYIDLVVRLGEVWKNIALVGGRAPEYSQGLYREAELIQAEILALEHENGALRSNEQAREAGARAIRDQIELNTQESRSTRAATEETQRAATARQQTAQVAQQAATQQTASEHQVQQATQQTAQVTQQAANTQREAAVQSQTSERQVQQATQQTAQVAQQAATQQVAAEQQVQQAVQQTAATTQAAAQETVQSDDAAARAERERANVVETLANKQKLLYDIQARAQKAENSGNLQDMQVWDSRALSIWEWIRSSTPGQIDETGKLNTELLNLAETYQRVGIARDGLNVARNHSGDQEEKQRIRDHAAALKELVTQYQQYYTAQTNAAKAAASGNDTTANEYMRQADEKKRIIDLYAKNVAELNKEAQATNTVVSAVNRYNSALGKLADTENKKNSVEENSKRVLKDVNDHYTQLSRAVREYDKAVKSGDEGKQSYWKQRISDINAYMTALRQELPQLNLSDAARAKINDKLNQTIALQNQETKAVGTTSTEMERLSQRLANYIKSMILLRGLRKIWSTATEYAENFNDRMNEIRLVTGKTQEEADALAEKYKSMAQSLGVTSSEIATAAVEFTRQGLNDEQVDDRLKYTTQYAKVANVEFKEASEIMTSIVNTYEEMGVTAQRASDVMIYLGNNSASSAMEVGTALQRVAAASAQFGVSYEAMGSYIAAVSSRTRQASEVIGTSFNAILSRIYSIKQKGFNEEDATKINDVAKALRVVGMTLIDQNGEWVNFQDIVEGIAKKWDTLTDEEQQYITTTIAGTRQQNTFLTLLQDLSKGFDENGNYIEGNSRALDLYRGSLTAVGETEKGYSVWLESFAAAQNSLTEAWTQFVDGILNSKSVIGIFKSLAEVLNVLGNKSNYTGLIAAVGALATMTSGRTGKWIGGLISGGQRSGESEDEYKLRKSGQQSKASTVIGIAGAAITAIEGISAAVETARSNAIQGAQEAAQAYENAARKLYEEAKIEASMIAEVEALAKKETLTDEDRNRLVSLQEDINKGIDDQKLKIDLVNGSLDEEIEKMRTLILQGNQVDNVEIADARTKAREALLEYGGWLGGTTQDAGDFFRGIVSSVSGFAQGIGSFFSGRGYGYGSAAGNGYAFSGLKDSEDYKLLEEIVRSGKIDTSPLALFDSRLGLNVSLGAKKDVSSSTDNLVEYYDALVAIKKEIVERGGENTGLYAQIRNITDEMGPLVEAWRDVAEAEDLATYSAEIALAIQGKDIKTTEDMAAVAKQVAESTGGEYERILAVVKSIYPEIGNITEAETQMEAVAEAAAVELSEWEIQLQQLAENAQKQINGNMDIQNQKTVHGFIEGMGLRTMTAGTGDNVDIGATQNMVINVTPVLPNGYVLTDQSLKEYLSGLMQQVQNGEYEDIVAADKAGYGIIANVFGEDSFDNMEEGIALAKAYADALEIMKAKLSTEEGGTVAYEGMAKAFTAQAESIEAADASAKAYSEQLKGMKKAIDEGGVNKLSEYFNGLNTEIQKGVTSTYPELTKAIAAYNKAYESLFSEEGTTEEKIQALSEALQELQTQVVNAEELSGTLGGSWSDVDEVAEYAATSVSDFAKAYKDYTGKMEDISQAKSAIAYLQEFGNEAELSEDALKVLVSYTGYTKDSLMNDLTPALWMLDDNAKIAANTVVTLVTKLEQLSGVDLTSENWREELARLAEDTTEASGKIAALIQGMLLAGNSDLNFDTEELGLQWADVLKFAIEEVTGEETLTPLEEMSATFIAQAEAIDAAEAAAEGYSEQLAGMFNAMNTGDVNSLAKYFNGLNKEIQKGVTSTYPKLTKAVRDYQKALENMADGEGDAEEETKDLAKAQDKLEKELNAAAKISKTSSKSWSDVTDVIDDAGNNLSDFSKDYKKYTNNMADLKQAKAAAGYLQEFGFEAENSKGALSDLASYTGYTAGELQNDLSPALTMLMGDTDLASNTVATLCYWLQSTSGVTFSSSNWQAQLAALGNSADTATAQVATLVNAMLKAAGATLSLDGETINVHWGNNSTFVPTKSTGGGGGGGGGSSKSDADKMSEIEKMIDKMQQLNDIMDYHQDLMQSTISYYESTGQLQGAIYYTEQYIDSLKEENAQLEKDIDLIDAQIDQTQKQMNGLSNEDEEYEQLEKDLKLLQSQREEDTKNLIANNQAIEEGTQALKDYNDQIRQMQIDIRDEVYQAIEDREEKKKEMLEAEVDLQNQILDILIQQKEEERDGILKSVEMQIEALEEENDLLDKGLELRRQQRDEADKQSKLSELEAKFIRISADPTRMKEALDIQQQIDDLRDEMAWDAEEKAVEAQKQGNEKKIKNLEDYREYIEDYYENLFKHPEELIAKMQEIMTWTSDEILMWLQANDETYQASSEQARELMTQGWQETMNQWKGIVVTYWDEVEEIIEQGDEAIIAFLKENRADYQEAGKLQAEAYVDAWREQLDNLNKALDTSYSKVIDAGKIDYVKPYEGSGSGSGGSGGGGGGSKTPENTSSEPIVSVRPQTIGSNLGGHAELMYSAGPDDDYSIKHYANGGLVDYTGIAMLHGSPQSPERVLSADQTQLFDTLVQSLQAIQRINVGNVPAFESASGNAGSGNVFNVGDIVIQVDTLAEDTDYEELGERIMDAMTNKANRNSAVGGIRYFS